MCSVAQRRKVLITIHCEAFVFVINDFFCAADGSNNSHFVLSFVVSSIITRNRAFIQVCNALHKLETLVLVFVTLGQTSTAWLKVWSEWTQIRKKNLCVCSNNIPRRQHSTGSSFLSQTHHPLWSSIGWKWMKWLVLYSRRPTEQDVQLKGMWTRRHLGSGTDLPAAAHLSGSGIPLHRCSSACTRCWSRRIETRSSELWRNLQRGVWGSPLWSPRRAPATPGRTRCPRCWTREDSPTPGSQRRWQTFLPCQKSFFFLVGCISLQKSSLGSDSTLKVCVQQLVSCKAADVSSCLDISSVLSSICLRSLFCSFFRWAWPPNVRPQEGLVVPSGFYSWLGLFHSTGIIATMGFKISHYYCFLINIKLQFKVKVNIWTRVCLNFQVVK